MRFSISPELITLIRTSAVPRANLKHTRAGRVGQSQHGTEIQIVGKHDIVMPQCPIHNYSIFCSLDCSIIWVLRILRMFRVRICQMWLAFLRRCIDQPCSKVWCSIV